MIGWKRRAWASLLFGVSAFPAHSADTDAALYGLVDMGYSSRWDSLSGGTSPRRGIDSGQSAGSRLGIVGREDLTSGVRALYTLEAGIALDTGSNLQNGSDSHGNANTVTRIWGRQSWIGLEANGTQISIGRQYSPFFKIYATNEPFSQGTVGQASNVLKNIASNNRLDNAISLKTPFYGDIIAFEAAYSGNTAGDEAEGNAKDKRYWGFAPRVKIGKLATLFVSYNEAKVKGASAGDKAYDLFAVIELSATRLTVGYERESDGTRLAASGSHKGEAMEFDRIHVGVRVPLGSFTVLAAYNDSKDRQDLRMKAQHLAVGTLYALSKRTDLYFTHARITTGSGLSASDKYDVGDATYSNGSAYRKGMNLGLRHRF